MQPTTGAVTEAFETTAPGGLTPGGARRPRHGARTRPASVISSRDATCTKRPAVVYQAKTDGSVMGASLPFVATYIDDQLESSVRAALGSLGVS